MSESIPRDPTVAGARGEGRCAVCGTVFVGAYCASCGERRAGAHDYHLRGLAGDVVRDFTSADGKVWRSARSLLVAPGELSAAYFDGRRGRYTKPLSLFVALNLVFFFVVPHTGLLRASYAQYLVDGVPAHARALARAAASAHLTPAAYAERFDARLAGYKQSILLYLIPAFAVSVALTSLPTRRGRRRFAVEHLIFSVHAVTFFLVASLVVLLPSIVGLLLLFGALQHWAPVFATLGSALDGTITTSIVFLGVMGWYLMHASRRFYGDSAGFATVRSALLTIAFFGLIQLFRTALLQLTLATA